MDRMAADWADGGWKTADGKMRMKNYE